MKKEYPKMIYKGGEKNAGKSGESPSVEHCIVEDEAAHSAQLKKWGEKAAKVEKPSPEKGPEVSPEVEKPEYQGDDVDNAVENSEDAKPAEAKPKRQARKKATKKATAK